jgi:predicted cupin superfamily sugar epimerase
MREGALTALTDGSISGLKIIKADGANNVILGTGDDAIMRVGWEGDTLVAIAAREDAPVDSEYAYWDDSSTMFKTYDLKSDLDSSFGLYETKVNLDSSFGLYETKVNLDSSFGNISIDDLVDVSIGTTLADENVLQYKVDTSTWDNTPVEDATDYFALTSNIDSSLSDIYTELDNVDSSLNAIDVRIDNVDASLDLYETKTNLDSSFGLYETKTNLDSSLNAIDVRIDNVDASLDLYETKVNLDSSFGLYETKVNLDSSFGSISIDDLDDVSLGTTLADENVLQYNVDTSTWDNTEVDYASNYFVLKTDVDTSLNAIDVRIDNVDASLDLYETKINLDASFGNIFIDDLVDVSLGTTLADENVLQYKVDTSTWDNTPVEDATDYFALSSNIDSSLSDVYVEINRLDASITDLTPYYEFTNVNFELTTSPTLIKREYVIKKAASAAFFIIYAVLHNSFVSGLHL